MKAALVSPLRASVAQPLSLELASTPKVLRSSAFMARKQPLHLAALLKPLIRDETVPSVGAWVLGAAVQLAQRSPVLLPARWLAKLAAAFEYEDPAPEQALAGLPGAAWNEPSLLGEVLAAARQTLATPNRSGRAGRVSAGCVYTPSDVARAIVAEVHVGPRRVVDPACGAGAFLLEAFERAYRRRIEGGASHQDAAEAALSHEIAGVDIDAQALAVAEFSLRHLALRHCGLENDVPLDLRRQDALLPLPDLEGQCECIVGNPPFIEGRGLSSAQLTALRGRFRCAARGKVNLFAVFVERSLELLRNGCVMALILPATFQRNTRYRNLREVLLQHTLEAIRPLEREHFGGRVVETVILRVRKQPPRKTSRVQLAGGPTLQSQLPLGPVLRFCDHLPRTLRRQVDLMERHGVPLGDCFEVRDGISTGFQPFPLRLIGRVEGDCFVSGDGTRRPFDPRIHRKVIDGGEFHSFTPVRWAGRYIEYDKRHEHTPDHPGRPFNCQLRCPEIFDRGEKLLTRQTARGLIATVDRRRYFVRNSVHVSYPKFASQGRSDQGPLLPGLFDGMAEHGRDAHATTVSLDALCACLNARLYTDYLLAVTGENGSVFPQVHIADLRRLPLLPALLIPDGEIARLGAEILAGLGKARLPQPAIEKRKARIEELLRAAFGMTA